MEFGRRIAANLKLDRSRGSGAALAIAAALSRLPPGLPAFPEEPGVLGAALASRTVRSNRRVLEILLASINSHVL